MTAHDLMVAFSVLALWDIGRRFTQSLGNVALERRVRTLEAVDHAATEHRLTQAEATLAAIKNQVETIRSRTGGSRWGG